MNTPLWVLLIFAGWTVLTLVTSIGVYRWTQILGGRAEIREWRADLLQGPAWYQRAMRAHANCLENLAVYTAVVVVIVASGVSSPLLDLLAVVFMGARVFQTTIHIVPEQTNLVAGVRFGFFFVQLVCLVGMGIVVAISA